MADSRARRPAHGWRAVRGPASWALLASAALLASCAGPVPTKPLAVVHVTGTIRDRDGTGVAAAQVRVVPHSYIPWNGPGLHSTDVTDSGGAFSLDLVEGDYYVGITPPWGAGLGSRSLDDVEFRPGRTGFEYRYSGFRVAGSVTAPDGAPLDSGRVLALAVNGGDVGVDTRNGTFSLLVPKDGAYRLLVIARPASGIPVFSTDVMPVAADTTVALAIPGDAVTGIVTDPAGAPLPGVLVSSGPASARTDASGGYRLWATPGRYHFYVDPTDVAPQVLPRRPGPIEISGPTVLDFSLAGPRWSGTVRWAGSGEPVAGARVSVRALVYFSDQTLEAWTGPDGRFEFVLQAGLEYSLVAEVPGAVGTVSGVIAGADSTIDIPIVPSGP